jgi:spoIIIJ-associated protein
MRFEGKSEQEAIETALKELKRPAAELAYKVVRDEKSFWGGRVVEIDVEVDPGRASSGAPPLRPEPVSALEEVEAEPPPPARRAAPSAAPALSTPPPPSPMAAPPDSEKPGSRERAGSAGPGAMDDEALASVEATLNELLSTAGFLVETRRRPSSDEMLFELIGDDVEPLLANRGEGLNGLEVLTGRIASKRLGRPVYPRLDAEGFRAHQRESLEELALRSANEAKRTRSPQLLPPLSPGERRLVHLALAKDPDVETESEGDGFLKRVAVRPRAAS